VQKLNFNRGRYFGPKTILIPPLSEIDIFSPLVTCRFLTLVVQFFPILHLFDAFTSHFLLFFALSSVLFYLFSFFLPLLIFFPRNGIDCFLRAFFISFGIFLY
jgi:hypothetical protein